MTACAPPADVALAGGWAVVMDVVRDLLDREGLWDPLMVSLGAPSEREIRKRLVDNISREVVAKLRQHDKQSSRDGAVSLECAAGESRKHCRARLSPEVTRRFHVYRDQINSVRDTCRNEMLNALTSVSQSYIQQVESVADCVASRGFEREIATIRASVGRAA
jgi:hypothetical protein